MLFVCFFKSSLYSLWLVDLELSLMSIDSWFPELER